MFYSAEHETIPRTVVDVMATLGVWRVWTGSAATAVPTIIASIAKCTTSGRKATRSKNSYRIASKILTPSARRGRTGDVRDRMVVSEHLTQHDDLEPRTRRAVNEEMAISLLEKGGRYEVRSASGGLYEVDVISESCTCPIGTSEHQQADVNTCAGLTTK